MSEGAVPSESPTPSTPPVALQVHPLCPDCGYDLTGNTTGRCPECGRAVWAGEPTHCPLCERALKARWVRKSAPGNTLYGVIVCKRCRDGFATRRQVAFLVDSAALWMASSAVGWLVAIALLEELGPTNPLDPTSRPYLAYAILSTLATPFLFCLKDGFGGYSPGKYLLGLKVVDRHTREPIGFGRSLKRNLITVIPYLGVIAAALTMMKGQRWGEFWANTEVILLKRQHRPPFSRQLRECRGCGYDLTGNVSGRCPECGREVPPELLGG